MARRQAIFPEVNFINGLITETTALRFPENACMETWNCIFDHTGRVTRRPGLDVEDGYQMLVLPQAAVATDIYAEYHWETVGDQDQLPFLVLQRGPLLYFFKTKDTLVYSDTDVHQIIDLHLYVPVGSTQDPSIFRCSFAEGRGNLLVVNKACDTLYLEYNPSSDLILVSSITIQYRDFKGVDDGLGLNDRPSATETGIKTSNPAHYYNLLNQGWHLSDGLTQWDTARTDLPSNADVLSFYRASETDVFDPARVDKVFSSVANTPAPKGHFILDAGSPSRTIAMTDEGFTGATVAEDTVTSLVLSAMTTISGGTVTRPTALFDGNTSQSTAASTVIANTAYIGKTLTTASRINRVVLASASTGPQVEGDVEVYAKAGSAPGSATDGTLLGTLTFVEATSAISSGWSSDKTLVLTTTDTSLYNHIWIRNIAGGSLYLSEMIVLSGTPEYNRPDLVAFYAGRAVYAGLANEGSMNSIYFSQIVERDEQYGKCYQKNDPTDENFFDLLSDDGGVITIPEIGIVRSLFVMQTALVVIASNGVWTISGSSKGPFKADDYEIRKISGVSTLSSNSLCDRRGVPIWWAEEAIFTITFDPQNDAFAVVSITDERIATFIQAVPLENRQYVKGIYDARNDAIYWLYREEPIATEAERHTYNRLLAMNGITGAFYPWSFSEDGLLRIKGFIFVRTPSGLSNPVAKFIIDNPIDNTLTFAEMKNVSTWIDWDVEGSELDYESYFITGYKVRGEAMKFSQIGYFMPFMDTVADSSLFMQACYDYTTTPSTGKWSVVQQCYNDNPLMQSIKYRRLKVPGKGRAVQFKMYSESGKPFSLIGWATEESVSDAL